MALVFVGQTSGQGTGATYTVSLSGTLTGGIASSPSPGDIVIVINGFGATAAGTPTATGNNNGAYPGIHAALYANDTWDSNYRAFYDIQGSTVDTQITIGRTGTTSYGGVAIVQVWRGVDPVTPLDVTATTATGTNASRPNPPAITPTTAGCVIFAGGVGMQGVTSTSAFTAPSNMTTGLSILSTGGTSSQAGVFLSYYDAWTSGSFDPNAATGGATSTSSSWAASTFVLRPFVAVDHATTGSLAGQLGSISGTATHKTIFPTSGVLVGQGSTIVGSATNFTPHSTSGTLTGPGSVITGDADREPMVLPHIADGAIVGPGSIITGSAARTRQHPVTGVLIASGAIITGDADREPMATPHLTEGDLVGQGAIITGSALRYRQHTNTGTLVGQGSSIVGVATVTTPHFTTGDLVGLGAVMTGSAERISAFHDTTGSLTGSGAVIDGAADHISAIHSTTGDLIGAGAIVAGNAQHIIVPTTSAQSGIRREVIEEVQREALKKWEVKPEEEKKAEEAAELAKKAKKAKTTKKKAVVEESQQPKEPAVGIDTNKPEENEPVPISELLAPTKDQISVLYQEFATSLEVRQQQAEQDDEEAILLILSEM